jgi:hypothetical protein
MHFSFKGHEFATIDIFIFVAPILAALVLTLIVMLHNGIPPTDSLLKNKQFIIMPKNCYLKIP